MVLEDEVDLGASGADAPLRATAWQPECEVKTRLNLTLATVRTM